MSIRRSPQPGQPGYVPPAHSTHDDDVSETESLTPFYAQGMARDSTDRTGSNDPTTGTATSSQTVGASQTKTGKAPAIGSHRRNPKRDPEPKNEEEEQEVTETPLKGNPGGDPGSDPDPKNGGGGGRGRRTPGPSGPIQSRKRVLESESSIPKLNHLLKGAENFAGWHNGLKLYLIMKDFDMYGEYLYWDLVREQVLFYNGTKP